MKIGTLVKVVSNIDGAPDVCLNKFGVVLPLAVFDPCAVYEDIVECYGVVSIVGFNYPGIEHLEEDWWLFSDNSLEVVSPEDMSAVRFEDLCSLYETLAKSNWRGCFTDCPKKLPVRSSSDSGVDWEELRRSVQVFSDFIDTMEKMVKKP
jgi:hypothetical protein